MLRGTNHDNALEATNDRLHGEPPFAIFSEKAEPSLKKSPARRPGNVAQAPYYVTYAASLMYATTFGLRFAQLMKRTALIATALVWNIETMLVAVGVAVDWLVG